MSVLVEAISILIPRHALDEKFPGGAEGFLRLARRAPGARWAIADERITCVSFESLEDAQRFVEPLRQTGLDGSPDPIAFVDQYFGPTAVYRWLRWRRNDEGFTSCWLEGAEAGELVTPGGGSAAGHGPALASATAGTVAEATAPNGEAVDFAFDAGLLPEDLEEIDVEPSESVPSTHASDDESWIAEAHAEDEQDDDPEPAEFDVADFPAGNAMNARLDVSPSEGFALALDEVPPPLPSDGWDPTEPVRDDASDLAQDLPPSAGEGLFEPLQLGAALDSALSASSPSEESDDQAFQSKVLESDDPSAPVVASTESPEEPILTFRPPVGDGWDEEEERAAEKHRSARASRDSVSDGELAARVAEYEAQFTAGSPEAYADDAEIDQDDETGREDAENDSTSEAATDDDTQLVYGAWLPDLPSSAGGAQPTPSSGTALLEAEDEQEDYRGYHESYASLAAEGIVPAFAVSEDVVERAHAAVTPTSGPISEAAPPSDLASTAIELARTVLDDKGWLLSEDEDGALLYHVRGSRARFQGTVSLERGADTLRIHTHLPTSVPSESHAAVAELLLRAAPRLKLGAFELDYETGEVRCRVNVDLADAPLTATRLDRLLAEGVAACDQYHDAVMQVVYAGRSVAEALAGIGEHR